MIRRLQGRSWYLAVGAVLGLTVASVYLACTLWRPQRILAARVAAQLDTANERQLSEPMRQLAAFGIDGLPHLVRALKHDNAAIASEARSVLSEELDRWQLLDAADASRRLACLAGELAQGIEVCSPTTRRLASDFATRILLWPVDAQAIDQQRLIGDCERVLIAVRGREEPSLVPTQVASVSFSPRIDATQLSPVDDELSLPGGGLPVEMQRVSSLPLDQQAQPRVLPVAEPNLTPILPPGEEPRTFEPQLRPLRPGLIDQDAENTIARIYQLVSNDAEERDQAETSLRQAGFSEVHLAVARRFADQRVEVRRELVSQLSRQAVIEARPWLLRLLEDDDRSVRLAAARVLVTSSDPQTLHQLRDRETLEPDPEVRLILSKATSAN